MLDSQERRVDGAVLHFVLAKSLATRLQPSRVGPFAWQWQAGPG